MSMPTPPAPGFSSCGRLSRGPSPYAQVLMAIVLGALLGFLFPHWGP
ncbi:MAG: hypothetical protein ABI548_01945 [Polyangiaceae bacterium]